MSGQLQSQTFVAYLVARVCLSLASTILSVAIGWHLYQSTGDPFDLALVGLMQILPILLLFLLTGWVIDRFSRKRILIACAGVEFAVFIALALSLAAGEVNRITIFILLFGNGIARAFFNPAVESVLPGIVRAEDLSRAVAFTTTAWTAASTAGPFLAGLLIAWLDFSTYWILALFALVSVIFFLALPDLRLPSKAARGGHQLLEGIHFVLKNPYVLPSISLDMFIVLIGGVIALLPVFAVDVLGVGPEGLGLLRAMPALGAVIAGGIFARISPIRDSGRKLFVSLGIFCLSILVFGLSTELWLSLLALFIYGASDMVSVNVRSTLIQVATPDALRGRVNAVNSLFISSSNDLGDFRAGTVAAMIGAIPTVIVGSAGALAITLIGLASCKQLRRIDRLEDATFKP